MLYEASERRLGAKVADPTYPLHDERRRISTSGHLPLGGRNNSYFLATALAGEYVGLREVGANQWLVSFMALDLGILDTASRRFTAAVQAPFAEAANDDTEADVPDGPSQGDEVEAA